MKSFLTAPLALGLATLAAACSSSEPTVTLHDLATATDAASGIVDTDPPGDASAERTTDESKGREDAAPTTDAGVFDASPVERKSCKGEPPSCTDRAEAVCGSVLGCTWAAACGGGFGKRCSEQTDEASCRVSDCDWNGTACSGLSAFCSQMHTPTNCAIHGCTWQGTCDGSPSSCATLNEADCGKQLGCRFE